MAKPRMKFEEALAKLEQIVSQIEQGQVSLEDSIEKYGEGVQLIDLCRSILDSAEKKIQLLAKGENGQLEPAGELDELDEPAAQA